MGELEVGHVAGEVAERGRAAEPRIEAFLFGHAGHGKAAIVVGGIEETRIGQRKYLLAHRAIERLGTPRLEVGPPGAADEEAVAGEGRAQIVEDIGKAAAGVPGRGADHQAARANVEDIVGDEIAVGALGAAGAGKRDTAAEPLLQEPGAGDMIGMDMRLQRPYELQSELGDERSVAADLLEHGIDQHRHARLGVADEIGIGRGLRVEELPEDHGRWAPLEWLIMPSFAGQGEERSMLQRTLAAVPAEAAA